MSPLVIVRGDRTILSAMDISREEFFAYFGQTINDLTLSHRADLERKRKTARPSFEPRCAGYMGRSLHICALRKLFPAPLFVHVLRDVHDVVRSMLNFHRIAGTHVVPNEEEAYKYWLRTVKACLKAEEAYGPHVIYHLRYSALVENPESALRSLLDFLGEPYSAKCLEPLSERINSSNVPPARRLSAEIEQTSQPTEHSPAAADEFEADFDARVKHATF
jgi:hypothetical protein